MAEAVGWAQMQVAQAVVAVKCRPEPVSEEPTPEHATRNRVRKTAPKQLSLTALFQLGSDSGKHKAQGRRRRKRRAPEQQIALFDLPAPVVG
jgi:hypothetical protein